MKEFQLKFTLDDLGTLHIMQKGEMGFYDLLFALNCAIKFVIERSLKDENFKRASIQARKVNEELGRV